jgi:hypothetical protein
MRTIFLSFSSTILALVAGCHEDCPEECPYEVGESCRVEKLQPQESFEIYSAELISTRCSSAQEREPWSVAEGTCKNGGRVLITSTGYGGETRIYDADGNFVALRSGSDIVDQCHNGWTSTYSCQDAEVTQVHCGNLFKVGQPLEL